MSISNLKARLSEFIEIAKRGEDVVVTDRGKPVARLSAVIGCDRLDARTQELIQSGAIRPPSRKLPADFWDRPRPQDPEGRAIAFIIEERGHGR